MAGPKTCPWELAVIALQLQKLRPHRIPHSSHLPTVSLNPACLPKSMGVHTYLEVQRKSTSSARVAWEGDIIIHTQTHPHIHTHIPITPQSEPRMVFIHKITIMCNIKYYI